MSPTFFFLCIVAYGVLLQTCALNDRLLIEPEQKKLGGGFKEKKKKRHELFLPVALMSIIQVCGLQQWHIIVVAGLQPRKHIIS